MNAFTHIRYCLFLVSFISLMGCKSLFINKIKVNHESGAQVEESYRFSFQLSDELASDLSLNVSDNDRCAKITADINGEIYCVGYTESALLETNSNNSRDIFFLKMKKNGDIIWVKHLGVETASVFSGGVSTGNDECYDGAVYGDYLYCLGVTNNSLISSHTSGNECVLLKIDRTNGDIVLAKQFSSFSCRGFGVDSNGIYIGGSVSGTQYETGGGSNDIAIIKVDHELNTLWERQLGSVTGTAASLDTSGNDFCQSFSISRDGQDLYCGAKVNYAFAETQITKL